MMNQRGNPVNRGLTVEMSLKGAAKHRCGARRVDKA